MLLKFFLAFTIIPITEIYLLIEIGSIFGTFTAVTLVILTGFLGAFLARMQGLQALYRIQGSLSEGRMPSSEFLDALLIVVAGLVLLTPGFLTDAAGFLLLYPQQETT
jgi:Protein affecting phage T7 exclusion by the F plasmid